MASETLQEFPVALISLDPVCFDIAGCLKCGADLLSDTKVHEYVPVLGFADALRHP